MATTDKAKYSILAVDRVLRILKTFNSWRRELTYTEVAEQTGIPPSTVYKLMQILVEQDFLEQRDSNGKYVIGREIFRLVDLHLANKTLVDVASPWLHELIDRLGFTASVGIRDGANLVVILSRLGTSPISVASLHRRRGEGWPIHQSAMGKALLLDMSDEELARLLPAAPWPASTPKSLCALDELRENLDQAKRQGCTLDDEESTLGLRCVGFPIRDHRGETIAAISVSATTLEITEESLPGIMETVKEVGERISSELGYHG